MGIEVHGIVNKLDLKNMRTTSKSLSKNSITPSVSHPVETWFLSTGFYMIENIGR